MGPKQEPGDAMLDGKDCKEWARDPGRGLEGVVIGGKRSGRRHRGEVSLLAKAMRSQGVVFPTDDPGKVLRWGERQSVVYGRNP